MQFTFTNFSIKTIFPAMLLLFTATEGMASVVTLEEASREALVFWETASRDGRKIKGQPVALDLKADLGLNIKGNPFFVFNNPAGEGFVILSGNTSARKVLAYSPSGHLDVSTLAPQAKAILEGYASGISMLEEDATDHPSWEAGARMAGAGAEKVLKTASWNQGEPYNHYCPVVNDMKCPTGCVATAMGIIMKYHSWPPRGVGSNTYESNGVTYSADFSKSEYDWGIMPEEISGSNRNPTPGELEVAKLLRDCGYAVSMDYSPGASGSSTPQMIQALTDNFQYHPSIFNISRNFTDAECFFNIIKHDIDNGFPLSMGSAHLPDGMLGGHQFVCDGYSEDQYVHLNYGWGGYSNGFYTIDVAEGIMGADMEITYGIVPSKTAPTQEHSHYVAYLVDNISYVWWDTAGTAGLDYIDYTVIVTPGLMPRNYRIALRIENRIDHTFQDVEYASNINDTRQPVYGMALPETKFEDGVYSIYPVICWEGEDWKKVTANEAIADRIDMLVEDGKRYFLPMETSIPLDRDKVEVDGICYILDEETRTATVSNRDASLGSYSGHIEIPSSFDYNGVVYTVATIGSNAFESCPKVYSISLPSTLENIEHGAFWNCDLYWINLEDATGVTDLHGWTLCSQNIDVVKLPVGLKNIITYDFATGSMKFLEIPKTVEFISESFHHGTSLKKVKVNWETEEELDNLVALNPFENCGLETVYVPVGTKPLYSARSPWNKFTIVEGDPAPLRVKVKVNDPSMGNVELRQKDISLEAVPMGTRLDIALECQPGFELGALTRDGEDVSNLVLNGVYTVYVAEDFELEVEFVPETFKYVECVKIVPGELTMPLGGAPIMMTAEIFPANATQQDLTWSSLVPEVAAVDDKTGMVTALKEGTAFIVAATTDGSDLRAIGRLTVSAAVPESIELDVYEIRMEEGGWYQLSATVRPEEAASNTVIWSSSNENVATVSQDGAVRALSVGKAVINASCGNVRTTCEVTVAERGSGVDSIFADDLTTVDVYDVSGMLVVRGTTPDALGTLAPGIYILRAGGKSVKIKI